MSPSRPLGAHMAQMAILANMAIWELLGAHMATWAPGRAYIPSPGAFEEPRMAIWAIWAPELPNGYIE